MNSIAAVVGRVEQVRVTRAAHHLVEVEHRVEASALANPIVDLVLDLGLGLVPARVAWFRRAIVPRYSALAASGDAAAEAPRRVMKSRRFIQAPRPRARAA